MPFAPWHPSHWVSGSRKLQLLFLVLWEMMQLALTPSFLCDREAYHTAIVHVICNDSLKRLHLSWIQVTTLCQTSLQTCTKSPVDLDVVGGLNPHMMSTAASNGLLLISNCPRIWCVLFQDLTWHDRWSEKPIQICCIQNQKIVFKCLHGHWLPLGTSPLTARSHAWSGLLPSWIFWTRCLKCPGLSKCLTRIENWSLCS
jgi:hypothetical protein